MSKTLHAPVCMISTFELLQVMSVACMGVAKLDGVFMSHKRVVAAITDGEIETYIALLRKDAKENQRFSAATQQMLTGLTLKLKACRDDVTRSVN